MKYVVAEKNRWFYRVQTRQRYLPLRGYLSCTDIPHVFSHGIYQGGVAIPAVSIARVQISPPAAAHTGPSQPFDHLRQHKFKASGRPL
jgi:hypothetical protein